MSLSITPRKALVVFFLFSLLILGYKFCNDCVVAEEEARKLLNEYQMVYNKLQTKLEKFNEINGIKKATIANYEQQISDNIIDPARVETVAENMESSKRKLEKLNQVNSDIVNYLFDNTYTFTNLSLDSTSFALINYDLPNYNPHTTSIYHENEYIFEDLNNSPEGVISIPFDRQIDKATSGENTALEIDSTTIHIYSDYAEPASLPSESSNLIFAEIEDIFLKLYTGIKIRFKLFPSPNDFVSNTICNSSTLDIFLSDEFSMDEYATYDNTCNNVLASATTSLNNGILLAHEILHLLGLADSNAFMHPDHEDNIMYQSRENLTSGSCAKIAFAQILEINKFANSSAPNSNELKNHFYTLCTNPIQSKMNSQLIDPNFEIYEEQITSIHGLSDAFLSDFKLKNLTPSYKSQLIQEMLSSSEKTKLPNYYEEIFTNQFQSLSTELKTKYKLSKASYIKRKSFGLSHLRKHNLLFWLSKQDSFDSEINNILNNMKASNPTGYKKLQSFKSN